MKPAHLVFTLLLGLPTSLLAQQPAPDVSLSVNGAQDVSLYPGWPLISHVTIMNSQRFNPSVNSGPLVIAPNGEPWTTAVQFTAVSDSGQTFQWPLKLIGAPASATLTLLTNSYVRVTFQMSGSDVAALLPGTYQLTASLQVSNSTGWNGMVQSGAVAIQIGPEPTLTSDQQTEKALLIAQYQTNAGDLNGALSTVQQLLTAQPGDPSAMSAAANLLELQGYSGLAFFQARDALNAYLAANPSLNDPPSNLLTMSQRLFTKMTATAPASATTTLASGANSTFSPASQVVTLSATVSGANGPVDGGTVTFTVAGVGSPVTSGPVTQGAASAPFTIPASTKAGSYPIQAAYNGTSSFAASADSMHTLTISKTTPSISWNPPASVASGTALGPVQLNATASIPGTFVYNPPAGTVLPIGSTQTLNVTFTPTDSTDYNPVNASVSIKVVAGSFSGSASPTSATIKVGHSQDFVITINSSTFQGAVSFGCAHPPTGISCTFSPNSANLTVNGSSTTKLTVTVNSKPTSGVGFPSLRIPADRRFSPRTVPLQLLVLATLLVAIGLRRSASLRTLVPKLSLALFLLLAISMTSCTSAEVVGGGNSSPGSGGAGSAATVSLVVQGTSGSTVTPLATISITVP
ncbi:MAG: Ig-like domain repeat protein [Candidatus Acidiferrum sp.]